MIREVPAFVYEPLPQRVLFDCDSTATLASELERLDLRRAVIVTTARRAGAARQLASELGSRCAGTFTGAVMHTPVEVTDDAVLRVRACHADALIAVGGGSTIGLSKAIALRTDLMQLVVPTTYSGSEATPIVGETADGVKTTRRDASVLPEIVIYDVDKTMSLGPEMSVVSGLNAVAHAIEALYAKDRNPRVTSFAQQGIAAFANALPAIVDQPHDRQARTSALLGAWTCGTCLGLVGMALHHKICHVLGGTLGLPHAPTHAVVLPHAAAYNERAAAAELEPAARVLDATTAAEGLWALSRRLGAPASLRELGLTEPDLDRVVAMILQTPYWNPQPLDESELRALLDDAFFGREPRAWA
jgi:maleylacetate reductase